MLEAYSASFGKWGFDMNRFKYFVVVVASLLLMGVEAQAQQVQGKTIKEVKAALDGMTFNGGLLVLEEERTNSGIPFLLGQIPNTQIYFGIGPVDCPGPADGPCQGVVINYVNSRIPLTPLQANDINSEFAYGRVFALPSGGVILEHGVTTVGNIDATHLQWDLRTFDLALLKFIKYVNNLAQATSGAAASLALSNQLDVYGNRQSILTNDPEIYHHSSVEDMFKQWSKSRTDLLQSAE